MGRVVWSILVAACAALAVIGAWTMVRPAPDDAAAARAGTVSMENLSFAPGEVTVSRGAEVVFDNGDVAPHTVTADDGTSDSGIIDPGGVYRVVVGSSFTYHCEIHPQMTGEVRLEG